MKTILFKIQQFPHLTETFILSQIILAIEEGYNVKILVKDVLDFEESTHSDLLKKYEIDQKIIIDKYRIPKNKFTRLLKAFIILLKKPSYWNKIINYLLLKSKFSLTWIYEIYFYNQFKDIEVIHIQYGTNVHPMDFLKKAGFLNSKLICSFHGHDAFFPINGFIQNNGYYDHLFSGDNTIVANTPYLANKIKELGCPRENLLTVPVPVDTEYFNSSMPSKNNKCLQLMTVGRLDPIKGHSIAINFIKTVLGKGIDANLTIVGEGAEFEKLKKQIAESSLEDKVILAGKKSQKEVRELMRDSDVYLFTGIPVSGGRRETQGLATLEAQACSLPVLAFDTGGVKYTMKESETGFLCPEYDMECLYQKLVILMAPDLRIQMGAKARDFVEKNFSEKLIRKKWKVIYRNASK